jgi:hypothetical protein
VEEALIVVSWVWSKWLGKRVKGQYLYVWRLSRRFRGQGGVFEVKARGKLVTLVVSFVSLA